ncbi:MULTISPECIES: 3-deoxy-manno-octulosonate cytidylyltransferase [unclassified Helicobacter]|uniref:3-deoxy-manno-octulosonate cytidylyltransferase n=1 Tax=unclassified Helicobacter TaxID=2593540 RepID=UPI000CF11040|nr:MULTISPECIES: 3-deoxy-manno-octulosonate cytidylyltransferase [unclassified Helicobacter]
MIIIPARLASTRFPQKMLADIFGKPLVITTALNASKMDDVVVACDDEIILSLCKKFKIQAVLTSKSHTSGTDRCAEACRILGLSPNEIVLNIQGDEPFLEQEVIFTLQKVVKTSSFMASLAKNIDLQEAQDSNLVKVVLNQNNEAIYFSRSPIPFNRDSQDEVSYLGHLGLYGFYNWSLQEFCKLEKTKIEEIEKLEQLRAIYHQKSIKMAVVQTKSIGIDTPKDLELALQKSML